MPLVCQTLVKGDVRSKNWVIELYALLRNMDKIKHSLLLNLADYSETIHLALEGVNLDLDERMFYLGHLAMCARIFKAVYLNQTSETLESMISIETSSFKLGTPRNARGDLSREAWELFSMSLFSYIESVRTRSNI